MAYPEPFFVTSTKDDRVHPGHARKMAAKMEAMGLPFLYYENVDGGHSAAANLQERARRARPGIHLPDPQADGLTNPGPAITRHTGEGRYPLIRRMSA